MEQSLPLIGTNPDRSHNLLVLIQRHMKFGNSLFQRNRIVIMPLPQLTEAVDIINIRPTKTVLTQLRIHPIKLIQPPDL